MAHKNFQYAFNLHVTVNTNFRIMNVLLSVCAIACMLYGPFESFGWVEVFYGRVMWNGGIEAMRGPVFIGYYELIAK